MQSPQGMPGTMTSLLCPKYDEKHVAEKMCLAAKASETNKHHNTYPSKYSINIRSGFFDDSGNARENLQES